MREAIRHGHAETNQMGTFRLTARRSYGTKQEHRELWGSGPGGNVVGPNVRLGGGDMESIVIAATNRPLQKQRFTKGWTKARRERFLDHVAATCNVRAAAEEVGMSQCGLYALRRRDSEFAEQWRMALLAGYDRLEAELLRKAISAMDGVAIGDPDKVVAGPVSIEQAIKILDRHQHVLRASGSAVRESRHRATQAETDAELIKRLTALKKRQGQQA
jgi:hypothetical protein